MVPNLLKDMTGYSKSINVKRSFLFLSQEGARRGLGILVILAGAKQASFEPPNQLFGGGVNGVAVEDAHVHQGAVGALFIRHELDQFFNLLHHALFGGPTCVAA